MQNLKICAGLFIVALLAACGASTTPAATPAAPAGPRGKLVIGLSVDAQSMDPHLVSQVAGESVSKMLFDHLIERDFDGKLSPGLAESWKVVDNTTLEFKLRGGVKFHNGEAFDAAAVQFSVERMQSEALKSPFRANFAAIKDVKVLNPQTVQFILSKTDAAIIDNLAAQLAIVPPGYVKQAGDAGFAQKPVGTGPFKFGEWVKDDHITLEANTDYWAGSFKGKALVQTVVFRPIPDAPARAAALRAGTIDIMQDVQPDQVKPLQDAGFAIASQDAPQEAFVFLVADAPGTPLADKRVRQAINYGVDVDSIIANVLQGYGRRIASPIGALTLGYDANVKPYPYDPAKAKQLLSDVGYAGGFDVVIDASASDKASTTEAVAGELAKLNIRATIRRLDLATFNGNWDKKQTSPMIAARWSGMFDPASALNFFAKSGGALTRYKNADADRLITEGVGTLDPAQRAQTYAQLSQVLHDDPLALYLWNTQNLYALSKRVAGWKPHPRSYLAATGTTVQ
ncbi:MAG: ABC transporter substrate-binding protein [Chloroflexi bacterium]|nr:ABC transporter substrate-binding protein [Chloroflexota bacterium]